MVLGYHSNSMGGTVISPFSRCDHGGQDPAQGLLTREIYLGLGLGDSKVHSGLLKGCPTPPTTPSQLSLITTFTGEQTEAQEVRWWPEGQVSKKPSWGE